MVKLIKIDGRFKVINSIIETAPISIREKVRAAYMKFGIADHLNVLTGKNTKIHSQVFIMENGEFVKESSSLCSKITKEINKK